MNIPFPPPPGQAAAFAFPTQGSSSGTIHGTLGADIGAGAVGIDDNGFQYIGASMWHSCGLCDWSAWGMWSNFSSISLPLNAGGIHGIYAALDARVFGASLYSDSFNFAGSPTLVDPGVSSPGGVAMNERGDGVGYGPTFGQSFYTTIFTYSLGTSLSILSTASIFGRFFATLSLNTDPPGTQLYAINPRLVIYYDAPVMPIGHACNANNYGPISIGNGITTAPGNGILVTVD